MKINKTGMSIGAFPLEGSMESRLQPDYKAFLRERKAENHEYVAWIRAKHREFRALNQIPDGPYPETVRQEFEDWL